MSKRPTEVIVDIAKSVTAAAKPVADAIDSVPPAYSHANVMQAARNVIKGAKVVASALRPPRGA